MFIQRSWKGAICTRGRPSGAQGSGMGPVTPRRSRLPVAFGEPGSDTQWSRLEDPEGRSECAYWQRCHRCVCGHLGTASGEEYPAWPRSVSFRGWLSLDSVWLYLVSQICVMWWWVQPRPFWNRSSHLLQTESVRGRVESSLAGLEQ